jgi:hypothetical protein
MADFRYGREGKGQASKIYLKSHVERTAKISEFPPANGVFGLFIAVRFEMDSETGRFGKRCSFNRVRRLLFSVPPVGKVDFLPVSA